MRLQFLGAARQVTGSRYLLEAAGQRVMIDCGLFQERAFVDRNWEMPLADPGQVDTLLLTHAHLDHTGLVPRLVAGGFKGPIITTEPSVDLAEIIMLDSARIQQEDAAYKRRRHRREGRRGKHPEKPLYGVDDARRATRLLRGTPYGKPVDLGKGLRVTFHDAGHILGSAILDLEVEEDGKRRHVVFSGDVGQWGKALIGDPTLIPHADYVVMESTYGDRNHAEHGDVATQLEKVVNETVRRGGTVVIPTFAVERAQELIYHFGRLVREERIPRLPIFLNSPMAVDVTDLFRRYRHYLDAETRRLFDDGEPPLKFPGLRFTRTARKSKQIANVRGPKIIMATSGMCTAGRIKHHLRRHLGDPKSTILFVGYQSHGTLGRIIQSGRSPVRIHGKSYDVRARIDRIDGFSAHGDRDDLLRWLRGFREPPEQVFLTHGEEHAALSLAKAIDRRLAGKVIVPEYRQVVDLD